MEALSSFQKLYIGKAKADTVISSRVKTGYVTNKVIGVDGGLFPQ